jgi:hypothetical protein
MTHKCAVCMKYMCSAPRQQNAVNHTSAGPLSFCSRGALMIERTIYIYMFFFSEVSYRMMIMFSIVERNRFNKAYDPYDIVAHLSDISA